jgi:hypothetical protein
VDSATVIVAMLVESADRTAEWIVGAAVFSLCWKRIHKLSHFGRKFLCGDWQAVLTFPALASTQLPISPPPAASAGVHKPRR